MKKKIEIHLVNRNPELRTIQARSRLLERVLAKNGSSIQDIIKKKKSYIENVLIVHA